MFALKAFMLFTLMYITSSSPQEQAGSKPASQDGRLNESPVDGPVTVPVQVLQKLVEISDKSKGLLLVYRNSYKLTKDSLLNAEVKIKYAFACRVLCMLLSITPSYIVCKFFIVH